MTAHYTLMILSQAEAQHGEDGRPDGAILEAAVPPAVSKVRFMFFFCSKQLVSSPRIKQ